MPELIEQIDLTTGIVITLNILLIIFSKPLVGMVYQESQYDGRFNQRLTVFRVLNLIILVAFGYYQFYAGRDNHSLALKLLTIPVVIYLAVLSVHLASYWILKRYGKQREIKDQVRQIETYHTRLLTLFVQILIFIISLITIVRILGFNTLLEAGGVIGFIGVLLALTQGSWAPDIFSGIIILNSDMVEEGDVLLLQGQERVYGMVFKTKVFHTEILNLINNHRIMVRNSQLRDQIIHNLSKFASAKGLREKLSFKIGYDERPSDVKTMLEQAWNQAVEQQISGLETQYPVQIVIGDTGDHAVEWWVFYHTKDIEQLPRIRAELNEIFLETSIEHNISLATPLTHAVNQT
ncbi:MAG: mechanosensitive ion channel family protein [Gammaproteobacteria bacterium]|nr:mechanosensitive ion channel family protein [Gammaproteobacteria bacterium]